MRRCVWLLSGMFLVVFAFVSTAVAADLTADTATKTGKKTPTGKICVKGDKYRMETAYTPICYIGRGDKGVFWEINGAEKTLRGGQVDPRHKTKDRREAAG